MKASLPILAAALLLSGCPGAKSTPTPTDPAADALADGQRALREGKTDEALASLRKARALAPGDPAVVRAYVEAHFRSGRVDIAIRDLEQALAANAADDVSHYGLGLALFAKSAGAERGAVEHLSKAAQLKPQLAEYHFRLGVVHLESERYPEAVESLRRARDLDPGQARHHVPLAMALARTGDRKGAIETLRAILELSPEPRDLDVARKVMARLTDPFREFPKAVEADFQTGLDYMEKADLPQQAIVTFEEILEKFPDLAVAHAALGLCYARLDDAGRAMDELRRALELAPEDPRNHLYVADLYFAKERYDRAGESYRAALERDPISDHAYERLAQIAMQRGDFEDALRWLKPLSVLRPDDLTVRQGYGAALAGAGQLDGAEKQFAMVVAKDPKNVEALLRLGALNVERRNREKDPNLARAHAQKAAGYFEQVLDLQPQNVYAAKMLQSLGL